jgi:glutamate--cysteine ligase
MKKNSSDINLEDVNHSIHGKFHRLEGGDPQMIGIELEALPFRIGTDGIGWPVDLKNPQVTGSFDVLSRWFDENNAPFRRSADSSVPAFSRDGGGGISFEPGGQIEYSSGSRPDLDSAFRETSDALACTEKIFSHEGIRLFYGGINPWHTTDSVGLKNPKPRYRAMDQYFEKIGVFGRQMMRLTASVQFNLDFGPPDLMQLRWLGANLMAPLFTAIFCNSPFMAGRFSGVRSYRSLTWQKLDVSRTGFPPLLLADEGQVSPETQYMDFALKAAVVMLPDADGTLGYQRNGLSFQDWMTEGCNGWYPELSDWESHLTLLFPEVRPKGFLECRFVDGQSKAWWAIPAILFDALVYDLTALEKVLALLRAKRPQLDRMRQHAAVAGVGAFADLVRRLFSIAFASDRLLAQPSLATYLERFYQHYTYLGRSPADELLLLNNWQVFDFQQYLRYENNLLAIAEPPVGIGIAPRPCSETAA